MPGDILGSFVAVGRCSEASLHSPRVSFQGFTEVECWDYRFDFRAIELSDGAGSASGVASLVGQKVLDLQCNRAVSRTSRARGYEPRPQDATPRSAFQDRLRKTPLHERGWQKVLYIRYVVK